jgi:hypothetical protein
MKWDGIANMNSGKARILKMAVMAYIMATYHHLFGESKEKLRKETQPQYSSLTDI